jgi:hypothetical protein
MEIMDPEEEQEPTGVEVDIEEEADGEVEESQEYYEAWPHDTPY